MKLIIGWLLLTPMLIGIAFFVIMGIWNFWDYCERQILVIIVLSIPGWFLIRSAWRKEEREEAQ
jgi:hypothetical protein